MKNGDLLATNTERSPRSYIREALQMNLEQRRELLANLPEPTAKLLRAHLLNQWEWKKYRERGGQHEEMQGG